MTALWKRLSASSVTTDPEASDSRVAGRTYAIPFERVWTAALALAGGGMPRWTVLSDDDEKGVIHAECRTLVWRLADDVRIDVGLDENGQTRVDSTWVQRRGQPGLGRGHRTLHRLFRAIDTALEAGPDQILDARRAPSWSA